MLLFHKIAKDIEIVRVVLLLTGSIQGLKNQVADYLASFHVYEWLWKDSKDIAYKKFMKTDPNLDDYQRELNRFTIAKSDIENIVGIHNMSALSLVTKNVKIQLQHMAELWTVSFSTKLHEDARNRMNSILDYIKTTENWLKRTPPVDLQSLRAVMNQLGKFASGSQVSIWRSILSWTCMPFWSAFFLLRIWTRKRWTRFQCSRVLGGSLSIVQRSCRWPYKVQVGFKKTLLKDIRNFRSNVAEFKTEWKRKVPEFQGSIQTLLWSGFVPLSLSMNCAIGSTNSTGLAKFSLQSRSRNILNLLR